MVTADQSRRALRLVTSAAVAASSATLQRLNGPPEEQRAALLDLVPGIVSHYSDGTSALAADFYDDAREAAAAPRRFVAEPIVLDRTKKILTSVAWASEPLFSGDLTTADSRLAEVVQFETARPYRDTILGNRRRDPSAAGWRRISTGKCKFCRMLADRGAVYSDATARFAAHNHCTCSAEPVFYSQGAEVYGNEASVMQYLASRKKRTARQRATLREYLNTNYPDFHG